MAVLIVHEHGTLTFCANFVSGNVELFSLYPHHVVDILSIEFNSVPIQMIDKSPETANPWCA